MVKRVLDQYRGELSAQEIAAGMNVAKRNAVRLLNDAQLLFDEDRLPSACSVAILAIEEAGKVSILRELSIASGDAEFKDAWRRYRDHKAKNATWIVTELAKRGARTLRDMAQVFDCNSDHPELLDTIKQLGFYTDCYNRGHWSEPNVVVDKELAQSLIVIARIMCNKKNEISCREVELWIKHVGSSKGTPLMARKVIDYHKALIEEGLTDTPLQDFQAFIQGDKED